jgi:VanZ family protein
MTESYESDLEGTESPESDPEIPRPVESDPADHRSRRGAAVWLLVVVAASLVDPAVLAGSPTGRSVRAAPTPGIDAFAVAHIVAYGVLAWLLVGAVRSQSGPARTALVAATLAVTVGVGVELLQAPLAARTASLTDALVNTVGAAVGVGLRAAGRRR